MNVILTLVTPFFLTGDNLTNLLVQGAPLAALAIGHLSPNADKGVRIGFVPKALNQEYWVNTAHGADAGGAAARVKVLTEAGLADTQIDQQIDIVQNMIATIAQDPRHGEDPRPPVSTRSFPRTAHR